MGQYASPYLGMGNNPVSRVDPDGGFWEYDSDGNIISPLGGEFTHYMHQKNGDTLVFDVGTWSTTTITEGESLIRGFKERNSNIDWSTITAEFMFGGGPENSMIYGDNTMNREIQKSPNFIEALEKFNETDGSKPFKKTPDFGLMGVYLAGDNMTAQMLGKVTYSFYPLGGKTLVLGTDSKSNNSFDPRLKLYSYFSGNSEFGNHSRNPNRYVNALGDTRQTYMFFINH